jgi:purine-binding chemotaxis protein CheW
MNAAQPQSKSNASSLVQYLSFTLSGEEYAVEILRVQEIRGICPITPLPHAPREVLGVMNLRGAVVPVVDLRLALGLPEAERGKFDVIVVLSVQGKTMGFMVDSVSDVLSLDGSAIEKTPDLGTRADMSMVKGIGRTQDRFVMMLDIERVSGVEFAEGVAP